MGGVEMAKKQVVIGLVGGGYGAVLHLNGYASIHGVDVRLKTLVDIDAEKAAALQAAYGVEQVMTDYREALQDPEIDVIDIVTPPSLHAEMVYGAMKAGKHVICEKPFTGYFGPEGDPEPIGQHVSKRRMFEAVCRELEKGREIVSASGKLFMYAENFVYAPNIRKAAELITAKGSRILFMKGEASLRGSSSPVAGHWNMTGGGSLMRNAIHPLTGMLWLKKSEAASKGEEDKSCQHHRRCRKDCSPSHRGRKASFECRSGGCRRHDHRYLTFSDGAKALSLALTHIWEARKPTLISMPMMRPLTAMWRRPIIFQTYFLDDEKIEDIYLAEMLPNKLGWNRSFVSDEVLRGYTGELQDFVECVAFGRKPSSDYELAAEAVRLVYAAYLSAEEGRRIEL
jgi:predicted dehydrogenase